MRPVWPTIRKTGQVWVRTTQRPRRALSEGARLGHVRRSGICVVRDVRGRVRLAINGTAPDLEKELEAALGGYFIAPIFSEKDPGELSHFASVLFDKIKEWPAGWPTQCTNVLGNKASIDLTRWSGVDRTVGKDAWLGKSIEPPWPLKGKNPPIATFHSFKGGVGRTTLVAASAIHLATSDPQRRVAIIDLDLEAPGIGSLFGVESERGVLDILIDRLATGKVDLTGAERPGGPNITVFPAGRIDRYYMQKLARLDFSTAEPGLGSPVSDALTDLLKVIRKRFDVILMDSRAGLHDLAGISLHGLAHVDVMVFRGTQQAYLGLDETLRLLAQRAREASILFIETMLPSAPEDFEARCQRSRQRIYDLLNKHIYPDTDPPQLDDRGVPHDIVPVHRREWLDTLDSIQGREAEFLKEDDLKAVADRLAELCGFDDEGED